ncbi:hypothetical protein BV25DRAFT_1921841 [Artomyces pyxidatus]|uniref:Uncharacterized protein n=1 Tax=Artomyces pyxidatus TaxID=48021 RepID=A0ACB8SFZ9_9AGAM|nr:hypothetical protein BV25DRAFT_1921841 [Artomyces pyxidatus]
MTEGDGSTIQFTNGQTFTYTNPSWWHWVDDPKDPRVQEQRHYAHIPVRHNLERARTLASPEYTFLPSVTS